MGYQARVKRARRTASAVMLMELRRRVAGGDAPFRGPRDESPLRDRALLQREMKRQAGGR